MTFTIKLLRPPLEVSFDVAVLSEAVTALQEGGEELNKLFGLNIGVSQEAAETDEAKKTRKPRGGSKGGDPTTAAAPAPIEVPAAPEADPLAIPEALRRAPPAASPPPPPLMPAAPPVVPAAAPPTGVLAGKIIADLDARKANSADGGKALADWLATAGITVAGATYDEAIAVVRLTADEKLTAVAGLLGVTA